MPSRVGRYILLIFAVIALASGWRALSVERESRQMAEDYRLVRQELEQLAEERAQLNAMLTSVRKRAVGHVSEKSELRDVLRGLQHELDSTVGELASLRREYAQLQQDHISLMARVEAVRSEKQALEGRFTSIRDLKLAIRDIRQRARKERSLARRARLERQRQRDQQLLASGNRGYVVQDGLSTLGTRTRLHVHVLEPHPN